MAVALLALVVAVGGTAYATGEGKPILGGQRNPGSNSSQALRKETQIIANLGGYGTRQSNKSNSGGGAIYGCRSGPGGSFTGNKPCIRSNNLSTGSAFEFATRGTQGGLITTGDASGRPFTTNATAVATGLNADRLDGKDAADFLGRNDKASSAQVADTANTLAAGMFYAGVAVGLPTGSGDQGTDTVGYYTPIGQSTRATNLDGWIPGSTTRRTIEHLRVVTREEAADAGPGISRKFNLSVFAQTESRLTYLARSLDCVMHSGDDACESSGSITFGGAPVTPPSVPLGTVIREFLVLYAENEVPQQADDVAGFSYEMK